MKKRKITIISLIIACITSLSVAVGSVFAWFFNSKTYDFDVEGGVIASYYESGDGTIDSPYEIARPIQLYYFAWLQDLGFYNGKEGFADPPYYFRVSHDLDMKDFVIPPIGTSENPFIGVFDGENHVISNLKVSNDALTDSASENATIAQAQILGFFGIVGDYDGTYSAVSSQTSVSNFALDNLTVSSQNPSENKTLVGLVAGYVNGSINNVYVASNSTVNIKNGLTVLDPSAITANFSDYALVGYCSTAYRKTFDSETTSTSPLFDPAKGNGWGGSIDMETLYNRLIAVRNKSEDLYAYKDGVTAIYDTGNATTLYGNSTSTKTSIGHYDTSYTDENGENITGGSYNFAKYSSPNYNYNDRFNYIYGYTDKFRQTYITYNIANETDLSFYIYANRYYLNRSGTTAVTNGTTGNTRWQLTNDGYLYLKYNNRYYFLKASGTANNSTLSLLADTSTDTFTEWEIYNGVFRIKNTNSYLGYNNGWKIVTDPQYAAYFPDEGSFLISSGSNYLRLSGTDSFANDTNNYKATYFKLDDAGHLYGYYGGYKLYLNASGTALSVGNSGSTVWTKNEDSLTCEISSTTYSLVYDGGWKLGTSLSSSFHEITGAFRITSGGNYLNMTGTNSVGAGTNGTTENAATVWQYNGTTKRVYTTYNGVIYYLNRNGTNLALSTTANTDWDKTENLISTDIGGTDHFIGYSGGWKLVTEITPTVTFTAVTVYTISNGAHYLALTGTNSFGDSSQANATYWTVPTSGSGAISTTFNGNVYYLYSNNNSALSVNQTSRNWTKDGNNYYYTYSNGFMSPTYYVYIVYNSGWKVSEVDSWFGNPTPPTGSTLTATSVSTNTISSGSNYLNLTGDNAFGNGTDVNGATRWKTPNSGANGAVSTTFNNRTYYLNASGTTLSVGTTQNTTWSRSADGSLSYTSGTTTYYLSFNGTWKLVTKDGATNCLSASDVFSISSENYYLNQTSATAVGVGTNGQNEDCATVWYYDQSADRFIARYNGNAYYLNKDRTNNYPRTMALSTTANATWTKTANGFYTTYNNVNYSAYYDNGWKLSGSTSVSFSDLPANMRATATDKITEVTRETVTEYTGETYFPIITEGGTDEYNDETEGVAASDKYLVAHEKNTGYIISGGTQDGKSAENGYVAGYDGAGNIRVSEYPLSDLGTSNKNGTYYSLTTTYNNGNVYSAIDYSGTITGNHPVDTGTSYSYAGATLDNLKFVNFVSARRNLNKLFDGATNVYGLHFMSATIDVNNKMVAPEVLVNGDTFTDYELPRNSIDFNLKEQGYITFFAGSYFPKNEAFFSLHNIYRNNDATHTLKSIYEIQNVYVVTVEVDGKDVKYFFYQYKDLSGEARYSFHYDRFGNYDANKYYNHNAIDERTGNYVEFTAADAVYEYVMSASGNKRSSWVLSFNTDWITAPAQMVSNALFYFEIPANHGEYALGSVSGKTGAYLIYLDIAAYGETESENSQEVRTTVNFYDLPKGIQLIDSAATLPETLDEAKSTGAILTSGYSGEITVKYVGVNLDDEDNPTGTCKFDFETTSSATVSNTEESDEAGYYDSAAGIKAVYPPDQDAISVKTGGTTYKLVVSKEAKVNVARLIVHDNINATDGYTTRTVTLQDFGLFDIADVFELDANGDILLDDKGQQVKKESFDKVTIAQMLEDESYKTVLSFTYSFTDAESDSLAITFKTKYVPYDKYDVVLTTNKNRQVTVTKGADMGDYEEVKITYNTSSVLTVNASSADSTEITLNP